MLSHILLTLQIYERHRKYKVISQAFKYNETSLKVFLNHERNRFIMAKPQKMSQYKIRGLTAKERQKIQEPLGAKATDAFKYTYPIRDSAKLCQFYILPH